MKQKIIIVLVLLSFVSCTSKQSRKNAEREFNSEYSGDNLNHLAFPIGGIGAGMVCLEGTGKISHVSVRNQPNIFNNPFIMAAIAIKGLENGAKVLEGPVTKSKIFGNRGSGNGWGHYGLPRFDNVTFATRFPFATIKFNDDDIPMDISLRGWSPFIPIDEDNSSLPVGGLEYTFKNTGNKEIEANFSFHSRNFMAIDGTNAKKTISGINNGFLLSQSCLPDQPALKGDFAIFTDNNDAIVDLCWFRGGWFDSRTMLWDDIQSFTFKEDTTTVNSPGASIYVPFKLKPGEKKTIKVMMAWYVPHSEIREGLPAVDEKTVANTISQNCDPSTGCCTDMSEIYYEPWYAGRFKDISGLTRYWKMNYDELRYKSELFTNSFYKSNLPPEVIEAIAANLTILKSPTVLRVKNGKLWAWEGCHDAAGCCYGSCTHVWNYAQAIPHLFPKLERSLRETEFEIAQDDKGHQVFRSPLPIETPSHDFYAAADGQLGGIMKAYREWRISGDTKWMKSLYPRIKQSLDYCIATWDPKRKGLIEEPHHNTYDIEFWGPDGMCTSFYLGALRAIIEMGNAVNENISEYESLFNKGKEYLEAELYDGEYFIQEIKWKELEAKDPVMKAQIGINMNYSSEAIELLEKEGPKYQYGTGCLSDGILGCWIGSVCGLGNFVDNEKVLSHLNAVYNYNFKTDLSDHVNPQRPGYAVGKEGGLLICSWPKGGKLSLPFVYSSEVWTGIEYQVASHLMMMGEVEKGLEIVQEVRKRYDGRTRNPFNEYECGHWYARAMASYGLLQGLTGVRYDAVDRTLFIDSKIGDFVSFLSTETGFGNVSLINGEPEVDVVYGDIDIDKVIVSGVEKPVLD
ncbi:hypothetical protein GM418_27195 [Maribellus comscasis]|uniref:Glycosyl-hydrolase family 116 catalytic region domain-containing protein n=1 Tax=Maribellus comscasis TaxID=2681766 RepID=A0A6I6JVR8_9BACT|nr:GH116 family glycosyl hydrolase [Maribellus comscasis]QGY47216.1 hypothetical protein GM418_27195 [Maribellus comscasis]